VRLREATVSTYRSSDEVVVEVTVNSAGDWSAHAQIEGLYEMFSGKREAIAQALRDLADELDGVGE